ncbi:immunity repressor [Gordonia phage Sahara]|uniref:Immunity repressor n=1 Tax=Gordonia phage Sahara TaxID=2859488 RepID=A0AAE7WML7_9CAUD|nr:transcriptional repressor [Gordonia phage Sahara]QYW00770.1 immunity repressor [Gordonia phage Sahara]
MNATSLRDLLQQAVDRRNAQGQDASFRALQEAVEAEENSHPRGLSLNRTTASQIVRGSYKGEPSDGTIRAIGWLAGVDDEDAFAAAGRRSPGLPFAEELPPGVDDLSPKERRAAIEMLRTLVAQRREINRYVDSSSGTQEPPAPREADPREKTSGKVTALPQRNQDDEVDEPAAARRGRGKTKGEQLRDRDAQLGEGPDPEGPEGGA